MAKLKSSPVFVTLANAVAARQEVFSFFFKINKIKNYISNFFLYTVFERLLYKN